MYLFYNMTNIYSSINVAWIKTMGNKREVIIIEEILLCRVVCYVINPIDNMTYINSHAQNTRPHIIKQIN